MLLRTGILCDWDREEGEEGEEGEGREGSGRRPADQVTTSEVDLYTSGDSAPPPPTPPAAVDEKEEEDEEEGSTKDRDLCGNSLCWN